jgi:hypothetical protein
MKYEVWTKRALMVWVPICLLLGLGPPAGAVAAMVNGYDPPWHFVLTCALMPVVTLFIVWRRHDLHARIRDSIDRYLTKGTRLVIDLPYMSEAEINAIDDGLHDARRDCWERFGTQGAVAHKISYAHARAFVIVRSEVLVHRAGKKVRVGGLTYHGGPMVLEYTTDLALLRDRARHEGCHYVLNVLGIPDYSGEDHHQQYPELFK